MHELDVFLACPPACCLAYAICVCEFFVSSLGCFLLIRIFLAITRQLAVLNDLMFVGVVLLGLLRLYKTGSVDVGEELLDVVLSGFADLLLRLLGEERL